MIEENRRSLGVPEERSKMERREAIRRPKLGRAGLREYTDEAVNDRDVRAVRERTTRAADDPEVTEDGVRVELETTDGRVLHKRLEGSLGNLKRPLSDEQLSQKFLDQATLVLSEERAARALELCWRIDGLEDVAELVSATVPEA